MIDFRQYEQDAARTCANLDGKQVDGQLLNNLHMVMGMETEVGEIMDGFKKNLAYNKPIDMVNMKEEIGDLMWYVAGFCRFNDIDLEQVLKTNIAKLKARYPEKFTEEAAINRNLDAEREILEK